MRPCVEVSKHRSFKTPREGMGGKKESRSHRGLPAGPASQGAGRGMRPSKGGSGKLHLVERGGLGPFAVW